MYDKHQHIVIYKKPNNYMIITYIIRMYVFIYAHMCVCVCTLYMSVCIRVYVFAYVSNRLSMNACLHTYMKEDEKIEL